MTTPLTNNDWTDGATGAPPGAGVRSRPLVVAALNREQEALLSLSSLDKIRGCGQYASYACTPTRDLTHPSPARHPLRLIVIAYATPLSLTLMPFPREVEASE